MKIKNKNYRKFLDAGLIETINEDQIKEALNNIKGKYQKEGRALLISLYYTGARPNEVLRIKAKHVSKSGGHVLVKVLGSKKGLPRTIYLQYKRELIKELYNYSKSIPDEMYLFYHFQNKYRRISLGKKGIIERYEISDRVRYYINKWFTGVLEDSIPPYFLRHNRFSKLAEAGISDRDLRTLKGSRTNESIAAYIHLTTASSKRIAKKLD